MLLSLLLLDVDGEVAAGPFTSEMIDGEVAAGPFTSEMIDGEVAAGPFTSEMIEFATPFLSSLFPIICLTRLKALRTRR